MRFSDWLNPLRRPNRRSQLPARQQRVAAVLETLEDRVMLSGVTGVDYHQVDADWFTSLGHKSPPTTSIGPSGAYGHGQGHSTDDFTATTLIATAAPHRTIYLHSEALLLALRALDTWK